MIHKWNMFSSFLNLIFFFSSTSNWRDALQWCIFAVTAPYKLQSVNDVKVTKKWIRRLFYEFRGRKKFAMRSYGNTVNSMAHIECFYAD